MLISAAPGALLWPAAMIVWGPGYVSSGHAHHCVQLVMALRGRLRIRREAGDKWVDCGAALVRPDAKHEVEARNRTVLIAFVEAESELGAVRTGPGKHHPDQRTSRGSLACRAW